MIYFTTLGSARDFPAVDTFRIQGLAGRSTRGLVEIVRTAPEFYEHWARSSETEELVLNRIVYQPAVLRHFAAGGEYGMEDWRDTLRTFPKPVLVLSGAKDRTTAAASAHELAELLPHGEEVVADNAAHFVLYERPDVAIPAIRRFLARV